ncbi:hypothetical protein NRS6186_10770 [Bacillus subtilis]|nr:hypothetical protein L607_000800000200 [Bacillus subtilis J24]TWG69417.1 hypothetical protein L605_000600002320 [Bacillus subtilis J26]CAF1842571.1 hypothetical protein NRS6127_03788 [Bacillus subtilis]CAF1897600.1 hypothetical protein NRS6186_03838 [Bacillus subtilis]CAI6270399.1 hypothetical protein NRS6127_10675 [Bacillus subtilis]
MFNRGTSFIQIHWMMSVLFGLKEGLSKFYNSKVYVRKQIEKGAFIHNKQTVNIKS